MERVKISKNDLLDMENFIRSFYHIQRYFIIRQFCWGDVLDIACGVGYGSYIISTNPDVKSVTGLDIDEDTIIYANLEYSDEKVSFINSNLETFVKQSDTLVSIETIEHLVNPKKLVELADRCNVKNIIVSYPTKKSTHFNPFHYYDFCDGDILKLFNKFQLVDSIDLYREVKILIMSKMHNIGKVRRRKEY